MRLSTFALSSLLFALLAPAARGADTASELDYFAELPEVLTVTRLAQPLRDTPGAVTILDRETIRRSGARELADLLRLVPGYYVSGWNGANPLAAYHSPLDEYGGRNLVLIDGRSVYSSVYLGGTHRGMMGLILDDIERIEVLRGSNSAAYGAHAMFGVINIITRNAADTRGGMVSVTRGEGGIDDNSAQVGWGNEKASFRISAARREDRGYLNAHDDKRVSQWHFRGDLHPHANHDIQIQAGVVDIAAGEGFAGDDENALRTIKHNEFYLHGQWRIQLGAAEELKFSANFSQEDYTDWHPYAPIPGVEFDYSGRGRRLNLEMQHVTGLSPGLRMAWGLGYKKEDLRSVPLLFTRDRVGFDEKRLFGNIEWRPNEHLTFNVGGFGGDDSRVGSYFAPRAMANIHVAEDHTFRIGATKSVRPPSTLEYRADVRLIMPPNIVLLRPFAARGNLSPERLYSQEIGYFGNFRDWRATLDVRAFRERMLDRIATDGYNLAPAPLCPIFGCGTKDFINNTGMKVQGLEYQLRWKALETTELWINQTFLKQVWDDAWPNHLPPTHASTVALFQKLPFELDLSLMVHTIGAMTWRNPRNSLPNRQRVDVRLAYPFRIGPTRAEVAMAVQAANGNYTEFLPSENFEVGRRAYTTLRIAF